MFTKLRTIILVGLFAAGCGSSYTVCINHVLFKCPDESSFNKCSNDGDCAKCDLQKESC